jgi:hypothetical protein
MRNAFGWLLICTAPAVVFVLAAASWVGLI